MTKRMRKFSRATTATASHHDRLVELGFPHSRSAEYIRVRTKQFPVSNRVKQRAMRILLVLAALVAPTAKSATVFEDRPALVVSNDKLELTVMTEGGALANLILRDDPAKL